MCVPCSRDGLLSLTPTHSTTLARRPQKDSFEASGKATPRDKETASRSDYGTSFRFAEQIYAMTPTEDEMATKHDNSDKTQLERFGR